MISCYLSGNPVHDRVIRAFHQGLTGDRRLATPEQYEPSGLAVVFGVYKSKVPASHARGEIIQRQRDNKLDVLVLETGYINRGDGEQHHYAAGFNGLNGRADFKNKGMPSDRMKKLGIQPKKWRFALDYALDHGDQLPFVLLCGQVPWDASVDHVDFIGWLQRAKHEIRRRTHLPIVFRPHPLVALPPMEGCRYSNSGRPLSSDLAQNPWAVVTFNSNSAVEAAVEGIPVFAFDVGSMAYAVANKDWDDIPWPRTFEREQWLNDLAYTQWTLDEFRSGEAWAHLSK